MGFSLKKLARGAKKIVKKNRKGVGRLLGAAAKVAVGAATTAGAGVLAAKAAQYGAGVVNRVASAPARRKAKKEKEARISKALAADIARPSIQLAASRDPNSTTAMPGGSKIGGARASAPKNRMTTLPGGAPLKASKAPSRVTSDGLTAFLRDTARQKKASDRAQAAKVKKQLAAEKKAAKAALAAQKKADRAALAAQKKADTAAKKRAAKEGTLIQSVAAGALGVKVGRKGTMGGKIMSAGKRKVQSAVRSFVKKSPRASKAVPAVAAGAGILVVGGKALDANAQRIVRQREKKLGRKLTAAEVKAVTTPRNTFLGK